MLAEFKTGNTDDILSVAPSVEYTKYTKKKFKTIDFCQLFRYKRTTALIQRAKFLYSELMMSIQMLIVYDKTRLKTKKRQKSKNWTQWLLFQIQLKYSSTIINRINFPFQLINKIKHLKKMNMCLKDVYLKR